MGKSYTNKDDLKDLLHDKKIRPWFWVFTILYFGALLYLLIFNFKPKSSTDDGIEFVLAILLIPYFIISVIYIIWAHRKDK